MKCFCDECIHNYNYECAYDDGDISIDSYGTCIEFEDYTHLPDYNQEFWRRVNHDDKEYKRKDYGKREEKNGIAFYHLTKELWEDTGCTEEHTGVAFLCKHLDTPDMVVKIKDAIKKYSDVADLPEEPDELRREW